jgi:hypothetical protein
VATYLAASFEIDGANRIAAVFALAADQHVIDTLLLDEVLREMDRHEHHLVLLLHEFEHIAGNADFGPDFYFGLRSLALNHNLSIVTSSRKDLVELSQSEDVRSSPFFNIFATVHLHQLSEDEASQLIVTLPGGNTVHFSEVERDAVLALAGCHPLFFRWPAIFYIPHYGRSVPDAENLGDAGRLQR